SIPELAKQRNDGFKLEIQVSPGISPDMARSACDKAKDAIRRSGEAHRNQTFLKEKPHESSSQVFCLTG
ncbi:MAG: hypothetical protein ACOC8I_03975, partial [Desulfosalsimonas sp.]